MSPEMYLPLIWLLAFAGLFSALYALLRRRVNLKERVLGPDAGSAQIDKGRRIASSMESVFAPLGKMLKRSPEDLSKESLRLVQAGYRRKNAVFLFYGVGGGGGWAFPGCRSTIRCSSSSCLSFWGRHCRTCG